jgi:Cu-Zn family superoxide dismutase
MNFKNMLVSCCAVALMSGIGRSEAGKTVLAGTTPDSKVVGVVTLQDAPGGLRLQAEIAQASPGQHAFHIHEFGLCDDAGNAAGSHYNPAGHPHGNMLKDGIDKTHAGDFGNIVIGSDGKGVLSAVIPGLTLSYGPASVAGRAFILHEKADDFSQPAGNAGNRIACGPILIVKPQDGR